ncbi:MAG: zinc ribbon domain-containing protein [Armatimonadetes bacterium]|nr:zinc ribbon domain-containing protein [Armatimonadota bacterium]
MPIYEYRCAGCAKKFSLLVGMTADSHEPICPKCGGTDVTRLISRFSRLKSEDEKLDALEESALTAGDDPASMGKLLREMGREMGEDGEEAMDEYMEEAEREIYDGGTE